MTGMDIESLIRRGATLKRLIESEKAELQEINEHLAAAAQFDNGKKTGHLIGAGYRVKVQLKENETWDQKKLNHVKAAMPDDQFFSLFEAAYKPRSKKVLDAFLEFGDPDLAEGIRWARNVKPGAPQVTFEAMEE